MRECWNGRQARLRCVCLWRVSSSLISRTRKEDILWSMNKYGWLTDEEYEEEPEDFLTEKEDINTTISEPTEEKNSIKVQIYIDYFHRIRR